MVRWSGGQLGLRIEITTIDMGFQFKSIFVACQSEVALCCLKRNAVLHLDPIHSSIKTPVTFFCRVAGRLQNFSFVTAASVYIVVCLVENCEKAIKCNVASSFSCQCLKSHCRPGPGRRHFSSLLDVVFLVI